MNIDSALTAVAAHGLPGSELDLPVDPLPTQEWERLLGGTAQQRLSGCLVAAIRAGLPATDPQRAQATALHRLAMAHVLKVDRLLSELAPLLEAAGVDYRVLKGVAVARLDYADPAQRAYADLDLLVPAGQIERALGALQRHGIPRDRPELAAGFDARFGKGVTLGSAQECQVDLHRTLAQGPFGHTINLEDLFDRGERLRVGAFEVPVLSPELRFLHACYHAAIGNHPPRLVPLRDVAQMLLHRDLDTDRLLALAARWRGLAVVARAITLTWSSFRLTDAVALSAWARTYVPDAWSERALAAYTRGSARWTVKALAALPVIPGAGAKAAYLRAALFPGRSYRADTGDSLVTWVRRGVSALARSGSA